MIRRPPRSTLFPLHDALPIFDVFVRKIRTKLHACAPEWTYIHTHFGIGYRFAPEPAQTDFTGDRKSTRLNSSHANISYAVFCLKKKMRTVVDRNIKHLNSSHA